VSSVGSSFSYVNDARSHEPEALAQHLTFLVQNRSLLISHNFLNHHLWSISHLSQCQNPAENITLQLCHCLLADVI